MDSEEKTREVFNLEISNINKKFTKEIEKLKEDYNKLKIQNFDLKSEMERQSLIPSTINGELDILKNENKNLKDQNEELLSYLEKVVENNI